MKNNWIIFFCIILLIPYLGFSQMVTHTYYSKFDTVGYIPPSFPGGYDSLFMYFEKNVKSNDSIPRINTNIYDALITFKVTEVGSIEEYSNKGSDIAGISSAIEYYITHLPWEAAKSKNNRLNITSYVQLNFTYMLNGSGIKIVQKEPVYVYNYAKTKNLSKPIKTAIGIFFGAIIGGTLFYMLVD
jgi:hypothetical protein